MERRLSPSSHSSSGSSHDDSPVKHHLQSQLKPQSSSYMMHRSASPISEDEHRSPRTSTLSPPTTAPVSELSYQHYQHYHRQHQHQQPSPHLRVHQPRLLPSVSVLVPSHNQVIESPHSQGVSTPRLPPISMLTAAASLQPRMQRQTSSSSASGQQSSEAMPMTRGPPRRGPPFMHPDDQDNLCRYRNKRCGYPRAIKRNGDRHNLCEKHRAKANQNQRKLESKRRTAKKTSATTTTSSPRPGLEQQHHLHHLHQHQQSHQYNSNNSMSTHESLLLAARRERAPPHAPGYPQYRDAGRRCQRKADNEKKETQQHENTQVISAQGDRPLWNWTAFGGERQLIENAAQSAIAGSSRSPGAHIHVTSSLPFRRKMATFGNHRSHQRVSSMMKKLNATLLLLLLLCVIQALGGVNGSSNSNSNTHSNEMMMGDYQYSLQLESYTSHLVYLAEYELGNDGHFDIALDIVLTIARPKTDAERTMLHLVVCDGAALRFVKSPPLNGAGSLVSTEVPSYCAMANRTLDNYCLSFPLEDEAQHDYVYRAQKTFSESMRDSGYNGIGTLYFLIDACETAGGANGVLRSCLGRQDSKPSEAISGDDNAPNCFYCPMNYPFTNASRAKEFENCVIPEQIPPRIFINAAMNLCNQKGECLGTDKSFLPAMYAFLAAIWAGSAIVWIFHIRSFPDAAVDLQNRMKIVPLVQCTYAAMTSITLYTENSLVGTARNFVINATILAQLFALSVSAEVIVLIAKGWKITRPTLHAREHQWIRFMTLLWATSFSILKNSMVKHVTVFLIWGIAWASVVFMIWYNSAFNMNMLKYQIAMVRQMNIDHLRTPVYTKYMLFRRFRGLLGLYMFLSCIFGVMGLVNDVSSQVWQWSSIVADETLNYLLYIALGYTFRCRRFRNLLHTSVPSPAVVQPTGPDNSVSVAPAPGPSEEQQQRQTKRKATLVVVLNPDQAQSLGTTYQVVPNASDPTIKDIDDAKSSDSPKGHAAVRKDCSPGE